MIWNGGVKAISAPLGANIKMTSHISAHHLGPDLAEKMRKISGGLPLSSTRLTLSLYAFLLACLSDLNVSDHHTNSNVRQTADSESGPSSQKWFHSVTLEVFLSTN